MKPEIKQFNVGEQVVRYYVCYLDQDRIIYVCSKDVARLVSTKTENLITCRYNKLGKSDDLKRNSVPVNLGGSRPLLFTEIEFLNDFLNESANGNGKYKDSYVDALLAMKTLKSSLETPTRSIPQTNNPIESM